MVKLIRLSTNSKTASFDNQFQDDIVIPPQGKIALLNIALDSINSEIVINTLNNTISWEITQWDGFTSIEITPGTYDKNSYVNLLEDIQYKLNESVLYLDGYDRNLIGIEWRSRVTDKKVNIEYDRGVLAEHQDNYQFSDDVFFDISSPAEGLAIWDNPTFEGSSVNNVAMGQSFISKGMGVYRCQLGILDETPTSTFENNGVIIGLSKRDLTVIPPDDFDADDISYAIKASTQSDGTKKYFTYTPTDRAIEQSIVPNIPGNYDANNDNLEIQINGGNIVIGIYQSTETTFTEFETVPYDQNDDLYPFICFHSGSDYTVVHNIQFTPSPYIISDKHDLTQLTLSIDPPQPNDPITNSQATLDFDSVDLSNFLGYDESQQGPYLFNVYNFIAQNRFASADIPDNFIVELLNLNVNSFDGLVEQRKNILYSLCKSDDDGSLHYETPNLLWIDLLNTYELRLRNIRARIVKSDYTPIPILNEGYMTIVIE